MFELDTHTLLVVTALISIGSAIALIALWRTQIQHNGAGFWAAGMTSIAVASILISERGVISDFFSLVVANSLYVVGFLLILRGIRVFTASSPLTLLDIGLPIVCFSLFSYFHYVEPMLTARVATLSASFMLVCFTIVYTLLRDKNAPWRPAGFAVALLFGLFGAAHGLRGLLAVFSNFDQSLMQGGFSTSLVFLSGIFILGGSAISLILLTYGALASELRIVSLAVKQSASSVIITNAKGDIEYVNPAFTEKTGYLLEELIGKNPRILSSGETNQQEYIALWQSLSNGKTWRGEFHNRKKNGELFWEIASIAPVKQRNGSISHYVAVKEDITALKNAEERILHMANHDVLTGLPTRRLATDRLLSALALDKRNKTKTAVMFVDIDGFKMVNDTLGHDAGDQVLVDTATRLSETVRQIDTVARVGGDEFWIILTGFHNKDCIESVAKKVIDAISEPYLIDNEQVLIGASIGIALSPDHALTAEALVKLADQAMYAIKRKGKNAYAFAKDDAF